MDGRAMALADRVLIGAEAMASYAEGLDAEQWALSIPGDGRSVGVIVHHVATVYPIEVELARTLASGNPIEGVTWEVLADMNAKHLAEHAGVSKDEAIGLLRRNAAAAAEAIRGFSDEELDTAACVSLYADAPLTAQFFIEDQALRHSIHHLDKIKSALSS